MTKIWLIKKWSALYTLKFEKSIAKIWLYQGLLLVVATGKYLSLNLLEKTRNLMTELKGYVDVVGRGNFFKEGEYCYCYTPSPLICNNDNDEDDTKNSYLIKFKFSGFNPESMGRISIDNLLYKKSQLPIQDYNTFILEIVDNITTGGTWGVGIIILSCVIVSIIITLILHMVPWIKIDGRPIMPGPFKGQEHFWGNSPKPKPMEPKSWVSPAGPNPRPFPLKDPGKKN